MSSIPAISLHQLTKYYGKQLGVEDITFDVQPGEVVGFLGPNGSGKTTVIRMLMGLLTITRGSAEILGQDVVSLGVNVRRSLGYLPGTLSLYENVTVQEHLEFLARMRGVDCTAHIKQLSERLELNTSKSVHGLSKGNKQKLGVIQAFMHEPAVLFLDEPTSGLDPIAQREFEEILGETRGRGAAVLLSSHVMHEVEQLAERVAIINKGHLVVIDHVDTLKRHASRTLVFDIPHEVTADEFSSLHGVKAVDVHRGVVTVTVVGDESAVLKHAAVRGATNVRSLEPSLDDIFLEFTGNNNG